MQALARSSRVVSTPHIRGTPLMPNFPWIFVPTPRVGDKEDVPGFRVNPDSSARQTAGDADYVPGFRLNPDGSIRQPTSGDGAMAAPVAHRPRVPLPKVEGHPGPSLHPPGRWRQIAPGFPWEWDPDPPPLPPPQFGPPHFLPRQPLPPEPWSPEPRPDMPWPLWPPSRQP
jgi:hypothetical protein